MENMIYKSLDFLGYPDYKVGSDGTIWSKRRSKSCWKQLKPRPKKDGHLMIQLYGDNKKQYQVHRLIALAFIGQCPNNMECLHMDGNPQNNYIGNLKWGTRSENVIQDLEAGLRPVGEQHYNAKLKDFQVVEIRNLYDTGKYTQKQLGGMYNVGADHVSRIVNYKRCKYIKGVCDG